MARAVFPLIFLSIFTVTSASAQLQEVLSGAIVQKVTKKVIRDQANFNAMPKATLDIIKQNQEKAVISDHVYTGDKQNFTKGYTDEDRKSYDLQNGTVVSKNWKEVLEYAQSRGHLTKEEVAELKNKGDASGFNANLYKLKNGEHVLGFEGSSLPPQKAIFVSSTARADWITNIKNGAAINVGGAWAQATTSANLSKPGLFSKEPAQYELSRIVSIESKKFVEETQSNKTFSTTGQSLGGSNAAYGAYFSQSKATVFNPEGVALPKNANDFMNKNVTQFWTSGLTNRSLWTATANGEYGNKYKLDGAGHGMKDVLTGMYVDKYGNDKSINSSDLGKSRSIDQLPGNLVGKTMPNSTPALAPSVQKQADQTFKSLSAPPPAKAPPSGLKDVSRNSAGLTSTSGAALGQPMPGSTPATSADIVKRLEQGIADTPQTQGKPVSQATTKPVFSGGKPTTVATATTGQIKATQTPPQKPWFEGGRPPNSNGSRPTLLKPPAALGVPATWSPSKLTQAQINSTFGQGTKQALTTLPVTAGTPKQPITPGTNAGANPGSGLKMQQTTAQWQQANGQQGSVKGFQVQRPQAPAPKPIFQAPQPTAVSGHSLGGQQGGRTMQPNALTGHSVGGGLRQPVMQRPVYQAPSPSSAPSYSAQQAYQNMMRQQAMQRAQQQAIQRAQQQAMQRAQQQMIQRAQQLQQQRYRAPSPYNFNNGGGQVRSRCPGVPLELLLSSPDYQAMCLIR